MLHAAMGDQACPSPACLKVITRYLEGSAVQTCVGLPARWEMAWATRSTPRFCLTTACSSKSRMTPSSSQAPRFGLAEAWFRRTHEVVAVREQLQVLEQVQRGLAALLQRQVVEHALLVARELVLGALAEHRAAQLPLRQVRGLGDERLVVAHKKACAVAQLRPRELV